MRIGSNGSECRVKKISVSSLGVLAPSLGAHSEDADHVFPR